MTRYSTFAVLLAACATGCVSSGRPGGGRLIAEHAPGETTSLFRAPHDDQYALFGESEARSPAAGKTNYAIVWHREVLEHHVVGFYRNDAGELFAVADEDTLPLAEGCYCWRSRHRPFPPLEAGRGVFSYLTTAIASHFATAGENLDPFELLFALADAVSDSAPEESRTLPQRPPLRKP